MLLNEAEIGGRRFIRFSTIDRSVLFSDSGRALPSVFTHQKLNFVYHYFFKAQLTFVKSGYSVRVVAVLCSETGSFGPILN